MSINWLLYKIVFTTTLILIILLIALSLLSGQKRLGYITEISPYNINAKSATYTYTAKIKHYDKVFRPSDIFNVFPINKDLASPITKIELKEYGKTAVYIETDKEIDTSKNLDIYYTLKIKISIICFLIPLIFLCLALVFQNKAVKKLSDNFINKITVYFFGLSFISITAAFVLYNLMNAGWSFGDDHMFLTSITQGKALSFPIWNYRFFPLSGIHFNLLLTAGNNPFLYLFENNLFLIGALIFLYFTISKYSERKISFFLLLFLLLLPDVMRIYTTSIFVEGLMLFQISVFAFMYKKASDTNKNIYYIAAFFICVYTTYCKEPIFGLFAVFALTQILFDYKNLSKKQKYFLYLLLVNAIIFTALYLYTINGFTGGRYGETKASVTSILLQYLQHHSTFTIFSVIALIRAFYILIKKDRRFIIFDAYLYSGIAYTFAFIILKFTEPYYLTPSYICYILSLSGYLKYIYDNMETEHKEYKFNVVLIFVFLTALAIQVPKTVEKTAGAIEGRKKTKWQTELLKDIKNAGYDLYIYVPNENTDMDTSIIGYKHYVFNTFISVLQNNGKYVKEYNPIKALYDTDIVESNKKAAVLYNTKYKLPNENTGVLNKTNFTLYGDVDIFDMEIFVQNEDNSEISLMIENAKKKYKK